MKVRLKTHFHKGVVLMQFKVIPLCLGLGMGMVVMKLICMRQETCKQECCLNECSCEKKEIESSDFFLVA